jgi:hypothetical protein
MSAVATISLPGTAPSRLPPLLVVLALADGLTAAGLSGLGELLPSLHQQWHAGYGALGLALGLLRLALASLPLVLAYARLPVPAGVLLPEAGQKWRGTEPRRGCALNASLQ